MAGDGDARPTEQDSWPTVVHGDRLDVSQQAPAEITDPLSRFLEPGRKFTDQDIILDGIVQLIDTNTVSTDELLADLSSLWPRSGINASRLMAALKIGTDSGLVDQAKAGYWRLSEFGLAECTKTRTLLQDLYIHTANEIKDFARHRDGLTSMRGGDVPALDDGTALRWARHLGKALAEAIRSAQTVYDGMVDHVSEYCLVPVNWDAAALATALVIPDDAAATQFLQDCATAAMSATKPFGTDLVSHITAGFVLHAVVARRDLARSSRSLGPIRGQRVALDTPILLQLLGPRSVREPVTTVLRSALHHGIQVEVAEHTLAELDELVTSAVRRDAKAQKRAEKFPRGEVAGPSSVDQRRDPLSNNNVFSLYAQARAEGEYEDWKGLTAAATALRQRLKDMRIVIRQHGNASVESVSECGDALRKELDRQNRPRSTKAIEWDAHTMAMVWRWRRRRHVGNGMTWPGGMLITPDSTITPAMNTLEPRRTWPFCLTLTQFSALVTQYSDIREVRELARATAILLTHEAEAVAIRFSPDVIGRYAHTIQRGNHAEPSGPGRTITEVLAVAQSSDDEVREVVRARRTRLQHSDALGRRRLQQEINRLRTDLGTMRQEQTRLTAVHQLELVQTEDRFIGVERDLAGARADLVEAKAQLDEAQRQQQWTSRMQMVLFILAVHVIAVITLCSFRFWVLGGTTALAALFLYAVGRLWAETESKKLWWHLMLAVPDLISLVGFTVTFLFRRL